MNTTNQAQLPPDIAAKHELTRLLQQLIPDVKTGTVDDFHAVIDRFDASRRATTAEGQVLLLARQWADEMKEHAFDLSPAEQQLLDAVLTAPPAVDEKCPNHCEHDAKFMMEGRCVAYIGEDKKGFDLNCGHRCDFSRPAPQYCEWRDEIDYWETGCKEMWMFEDGGPVENRMKFCHGCGKPIKIYEPSVADPDHLNPAKGGNKAADDYW